MKILLTNDELHEVRGGTQAFIADLARALRGRGHEVAVCSWLRGSLARELQEQGVPVVGQPRDCGFVPDVIHAQHHLAAMTALCAFPGVPAIYHCHGYGPWQERPPAHPRILRYVVMAEAMVEWTAELGGRKKEEVIVLPNSIDLRRFRRVRALESAPRRALLFGNSLVPTDSISTLRKACLQRGLALDLVGAQFGNATPAPEELLPEYDLVFAVGRSALEAMSSGCAVVIFGDRGCGPMIGPDNLQEMLKRNLTVPEFAPALTEENLDGQLDKFDPDRAAAVAAAVRSSFDFEHTCNRLEALYQQSVGGWRDHPRISSEDDSLALSAYLAGLGPHIKGADERFAALRLNRDKSKLRLGKLKLKVAALEKKMARIESRLPGIIRRWLFRGMR